MTKFFLMVLFIIGPVGLRATTLHVGIGQAFPDPSSAALTALPGDTILVHAGSYQGTFWFENIHGTESAWITICGEDESLVLFDGGSESMHFSDCSYVRICRITVSGQTGNGMNIDDAGSTDTPAHHIEVSEVTFKNMAASGNNDMLKLSGLEDFVILQCSFTNGAAGGSGIDMVGCHRGQITQCSFQTMGSNAIQAKGGTQFIRIERNRFENAGARGINLGGSTGLDFFRPHDAPFEAADLQVYANFFDGSQTPLAYVGSVRVDVANNVIRNPGKWVFRILQETTEPAGRFLECGNNYFRNNVVLFSPDNRPTVNIGPNTNPESFTVTHNLCYDGSASTTSPFAGYPFQDPASIIGQDPLLTAECPSPNSPLIAAGISVKGATVDFYGKQWGIPPSIGACELDNPTGVRVNAVQETTPCCNVAERPPSDLLIYVNESCAPLTVVVYSVLGQIVFTQKLEGGFTTIHTVGGWYGVHVIPKQ